MTFTEFQEIRRTTQNLGEILHDAMFWNCPGIAYLGHLWVQVTKDWTPSVIGYGRGRWLTMIGRTEIQSDDLEDCERPLFEHAVMKGWIA